MSKTLNNTEQPAKLLLAPRKGCGVLRRCEGYRLVLNCSQSEKNTGSTALAVTNRRKPVNQQPPYHKE